jgi:hypothetical protein
MPAAPSCRCRSAISSRVVDAAHRQAVAEPGAVVGAGACRLAQLRLGRRARSSCRPENPSPARPSGGQIPRTSDPTGAPADGDQMTPDWRAACPALRTGRPRAHHREARDPDRAAVRRAWDRRRGVHRARHATAAGRRAGSLRRARSRRQRTASVALATATATTSSAGWRRSMGSRAAVLG